MSFLSFFLNDFKFFLPEIFLATSILSLTLYCSLVATSRELGFPVMVKSLNKLCLLVLFFSTFSLQYSHFISPTVALIDFLE